MTETYTLQDSLGVVVAAAERYSFPVYEHFFRVVLTDVVVPFDGEALKLLVHYCAGVVEIDYAIVDYPNIAAEVAIVVVVIES